MALGPGVPDPSLGQFDHPYPNAHHRRADAYGIRARSILGGLHHKYFIAPNCA